MTHHETSGSEHPIWEGAVVGLLAAAEMGMIPREQVIPTTTQVIVDLRTSGMLEDIGEVQGYLRGRRASIQLVAVPFDAEAMAQSDIECLDIVTGEPRGYYMQVSMGYNEGETEAETELRRAAMSHEANEYILSVDTGVLTLKEPML